MDQDKRQRREMKRILKKAGNKHRRQQLKRVLDENPDQAAEIEPTFGRYSTAGLNGLDRDSTRRQAREPES